LALLGYIDLIIALTPLRSRPATSTTSVATSSLSPTTSVSRSLRPRLAVDPYGIGMPARCISAAARPLGASAHGMCGHNAAGSALRHLETG
jgi:hypothetical protein